MMHRKSFSDKNNKKGIIGSIVKYARFDTIHDESKTVKEIISKGRGGTRIYFEEGGYGTPSDYIIDEDKTS